MRLVGHAGSVLNLGLEAGRRGALIGFPLLAVAGCARDLSTLQPAGPVAQGIATLWWAMFWGGLAIFVVMMALFLWLWLRPDSGRRVPTLWWIAGGGIAFPLPVILILTGVALWQGERALGGSAPIKVEAEAVMWEWRFSYPDTTMEPTVDLLHIPAGQDVEIVVTSPDVIHSFWVPRLGGKIDAVPGHANTIVLHADRAGDFGGVCAEYCGVGHQDMAFTVTAHDAWPVQP